ncbi:MAG: hypothetical protein JST93_12810 [Acidobacteria bacterium]|nr:hypothetical protein [Acidobacteriota bacterium]
MAYPDYVQTLGTGWAPSTSVSALLTVGVNHTAGNSLYLGLGVTTNTRLVQSIVDSAGNSWTQLRQPSTIGIKHLAYVSDGASALASGSTVLITFNGATNIVAGLVEINRMSTTEEASGSWTSANTSTPSGTITTLSSGSIVFASFSDLTTVGSGTALESSGFISAIEFHHPTQSLHLHIGYREADVPEAVTYVATLDQSKAVAINMSAFPAQFTIIELPGPIARRSILPLTGLG